MPSGFWTRLIATLSAAALVGGALLLGLGVEELFKLVGLVSLVLAGLTTAFNAFAWKWLPLWLSKRPNIDGTWRGHIVADYVNPQTGESGSGPCYLVVRPTFVKVTVQAIFPRSESFSLIADLVDRNGHYYFYYIYASAAELRSQRGNPPHQGATVLTVATTPAPRLEGDYWGARDDSRGRITTIGRSKKHYSRFADAETGAYD